MKTITQNNASTKTGLFETNKFVECGGFADQHCAKLVSQDQHLQHALSPAQKMSLSSATKNRFPTS